MLKKSEPPRTGVFIHHLFKFIQPYMLIFFCVLAAGAPEAEVASHTNSGVLPLELSGRGKFPGEHSTPRFIDGVLFLDPNLSSDLLVILNGRRLFNNSIFPLSQRSNGASGAVRFSLPDVPSGSHILEFVHPLVTFPKFKLVIYDREAAGPTAEPVCEVFSLGEYMTQVSTVPSTLPLKVYPLGITDYYPSRGGFNLFGLLTQPMVLLTLVSFIIMLFVPKLQQQHLEEERLQQHMHIEQQRSQSTGRSDQASFVESSLESPIESVFVENALQL